MEADDGEFRPTDEVDELRWLPPDAASRTLSYERDRALLRAAETTRDG
jgi:8-oxo-dGTP diphosphatase